MNGYCFRATAENNNFFFVWAWHGYGATDTSLPLLAGDQIPRTLLVSSRGKTGQLHSSAAV